MVYSVIGLRAGFGGYQAKGYSVKDAGFAYKRVDTNVYRTKWGILHLHGDVMLNFTNCSAATVKTDCTMQFLT